MNAVTKEFMEEPINDDNVIRLALSHAALFKSGIPDDSTLPDGWYDCVNRLCADIELELGMLLTPCARVLQIKEKFGRLRFYCSFVGDDEVPADARGGGVHVHISTATEQEASKVRDVASIRQRLGALVCAAEEASARICQACGMPGTRRRLSWIRTLCDEHFQIALAHETELD